MVVQNVLTMWGNMQGSVITNKKCGFLLGTYIQEKLFVSAT